MFDAVRDVLQACYDRAEHLYAEKDTEELQTALGPTFPLVATIAARRHAARGFILTLASYKAAFPQQDIRIHKAEFQGGFAARTIDKAVTVPFLIDHALRHNVETHWLTQTFSYACPLSETSVIPTRPPYVGPAVVTIVNAIESSQRDFAVAVAVLILYTLIDDRNRGRVQTIKPKNLSIDGVMSLLRAHFERKYSTNAPRLPQIAIYAMYECLMKDVARYRQYSLRPLERMKAANRKSGSVGDIDVEYNTRPIEAVEIKFEQAITLQHVLMAIEKISRVAVERYFILSTVGISEVDAAEIKQRQTDFRASNGCEIIVNGIYDTLRYYLRLLPSANEFVQNYAERLESDVDLDYEHRIAWNEVCRQRHLA